MWCVVFGRCLFKNSGKLLMQCVFECGLDSDVYILSVTFCTVQHLCSDELTGVSVCLDNIRLSSGKFTFYLCGKSYCALLLLDAIELKQQD